MSHSRPQSKLSSPARKFFACQLLSCSPDDKGTSSGSHVDWWIFHPRSGSDIVFSQVWLQGIVVLVSADGNDVLLDDGTAVVHASGITKIVKNASFCKGMYVMIAGQLISVGTEAETSYSSIKVLKVANLSENLTCEAMWLLEVLDAQMQEDQAIRVEPRYNEPLHNEVPSVTNNILQPSWQNYSKMYGTEPRYNEPPL